MATTVIGLFDSTQRANMAVRDLETSGVSKSNVEVISKPGGAAGGLTDKLRNAGIPDDMVRAYDEGIRRGHTLVHVSAEDRSADLVADVLDRHGAMHIEDLLTTRTTSQAAGARPAQQPQAAKPTPGRAAREAAPGESIREQVVQEELVVGKQPVARGGVRIFTRTSERPVTERIGLRDETIRVDRRPVDRPATEADINRPGDREAVIREVDEEPVVGKRARVVEEVVVSKEAHERQETVRDTVRRRDVDVQPLQGGGPETFARYENDFRGHFDQSFRSRGGAYEEYAPAYRFGGELAADKRFAGRDWTTIRSEARADWERRNPGSTWDRVENAVQYGWEKLRGRG